MTDLLSSTPSGRLVRSSRNAKHLSYGATGLGRLTTVQDDIGQGDKLQRLKIIYSTGTNCLTSTQQLIITNVISLGERFGLRIIPGKNSFLVLPNNISRSTAVGAILHPGGPARSPMSGTRGPWFSSDFEEVTTVGEGLDLLIAISSDEKLLRRLNEFDNSETCSTSDRGTDAKWKLDTAEVKNVLEMFVRSYGGSQD